MTSGASPMPSSLIAITSSPCSTRTLREMCPSGSVYFAAFVSRLPMICDTRSGTAYGVGFILAVVVATGAAAATLDRRALRPTLFLALGLALIPPFGGHALDSGLSRVNVVADALHVLGASAWVGARSPSCKNRAIPSTRPHGASTRT